MTTTSCTLVDSARLRSGRTVVSKWRGRGIPASAIATGFPQKSLLENDIDVADPAGTQYRMEVLTQPSAGVLTVYEDSSFSFTGAPDNTYTGTETVYKNGVPDAGSYSFTIGQAAPPPDTSPKVTGISITPTSATVSEGNARQFSATVAGTNSPSQVITWSGIGINASGLFFAPAATASVQTITITATSVQDGAFSATATITVPAAIPRTVPPAFVTTIHTRARKRSRR